MHYSSRTETILPSGCEIRKGTVFLGFIDGCNEGVGDLHVIENRSTTKINLHMPKYDINDPTDLDIMRAQFDIISGNDWEEYLEIAEERNMHYKNINILKTAQRKAGISKYLSPKVILWVLSLVDQLDSNEEE